MIQDLKMSYGLHPFFFVMNKIVKVEMILAEFKRDSSKIEKVNKQ